jgi:hypothetical protein
VKIKEPRDEWTPLPPEARAGLINALIVFLVEVLGIATTIIAAILIAVAYAYIR